jgi:hypothetical protein
VSRLTHPIREIERARSHGKNTLSLHTFTLILDGPTELDSGLEHAVFAAGCDDAALGQDLDPVGFLWDFKDRIYHVDCKEAKMQLNGRNGRLGSHLPWADPRRGWDFVSVGHGDVPWEACFRMLNAIGYDGPISVEWEDAGMDRLFGGPEALEFLRKLDWDVPSGSFDDAFASE